MKASDFGLIVTGSSAGQELVLCPFHADQHSSAWYDPVKGLFYCAVCNTGYNNSQLAKHLGLDYEEIRFGHEDDEVDDYDLLGNDVYKPTGEITYTKYFMERKVSPSVTGYYGIRWSYEARAAVIPITDVLGHEIGCAMRYETGSLRYMFLGSTAPLWPMHKLRHIKETDFTIVTEGAWSAMRIQSVFCKLTDQTGNFFALLGAKANERVAQVLMSLPGKVVVLYDNDEAGIRASEKLRRQVTGVEISTVDPSPDDMDDDEILHHILQERISVVKV